MSNSKFSQVFKGRFLVSALKRNYAGTSDKGGSINREELKQKEHLFNKQKEVIETLKNKLTEENNFRAEQIKRHQEAIENNRKVIEEIEDNMRNGGY